MQRPCHIAQPPSGRRPGNRVARHAKGGALDARRLSRDRPGQLDEELSVLVSESDRSGH